MSKHEQTARLNRFGDSVALDLDTVLHTVYLSPDMAWALAHALVRISTDCIEVDYRESEEGEIQLQERSHPCSN